MSRTLTVIGPEHHGQPMSLGEFEHAEGREGCLYELSRGVVTVIDVPQPYHLQQIAVIRQQLSEYKVHHPEEIHVIAGGGESKILLQHLQSERHPDLSVYKTPPPANSDDVWSIWIPEIVVEVVSPGSEHRDYVEKREEYLQFGIREYWIVDADRQQMLVLRRSRGTWQEEGLRPPASCRTPLLPGLELDVQAILSAGGDSS